jgi:hypothetical protein
MWNATRGYCRRGLCRLAVMTAVTVGLAGTGAGLASAASLRVCAHGCAYSQIGAAVTAAAPGDHVLVAQGRYHGGFTIDKDLTLSGAGAGRTIVLGGGPVITVGVALASSEPNVTISDLTITGGVTTHSSIGDLLGQLTQLPLTDSDEALGGGVLIPPSANFGVGANVVIARSVISGNLAAPETSVPVAGFSCGAADCHAAQAGGGGVDSWGETTIRDSVVSDNQSAGPTTSDADGAGIYAQAGSLDVDHTVVTANRAVAQAPYGRFAEGAGIMVDTFFSPPGTCGESEPRCQLTVRQSAVSGNTSMLTNTLPSFGNGQLISTLANAGGIHVGDDIQTVVENSAIADNTATASDTQGEPAAIDAGMIIGDSPLTMQHTQIDGNLTQLTAATTADVGVSGTAIELDGAGTITDSSITGNVTTVSTPDAGAAAASGGLGVFNFSGGEPQLVTLRDSVIAGNITTAHSATGSATVLGGAVFNNSLLAMHHVLVNGNVGRAEGTSGVDQGGGIWNGVDFSGPPVELTLDHSRVTANALSASPGITRQGGGLFTTFPVTLNNTLIALNRPDQCFGCTPSAQTMARSGERAAARPRSTRVLAP